MKQQLIQAVDRFWGSKLYAAVCAAGILLCHTFAWEAVVFPALLLLFLIGCFFADNERFVFAPFCGAVLGVPLAHTPTVPTNSDAYLTGAAPYLLGVGAFAFFAGMVVYAVRQRKKFPRGVTKTALFWGFALFGVSLLTSGLFADGYTAKNLLYALCLSLSLPLLYFWLCFAGERKKETAEYFLFTAALLGLAVFAELAIGYFTTVTWENGLPVKESVALGWGFWTQIGAYFVWVLPSAFYFLVTRERLSPALALCPLFPVGMVLSACRGALLWGGVIFLVCLGYGCFSGASRCRKTCRVFACVLLGGAALVLAIWGAKIFAALGGVFRTDLGDNGRFALWRQAWERFTVYPVFGSGWFGDRGEVGWGGMGVAPALFHNTPLQMLGTCGAVGFLAYVFHRVQTVRLLWQKRASPLCLFLLFTAAAVVLSSLTDEHIFHIYPAFFYTFALYYAEGEY